MKKLLRWSAYGAGGLVALLLVAAAAIFILSEVALGKRHEARPETLAAVTPAQLADAGRVAKLYGCTNCHGDGMKGRVMDEVPAMVVRVVAPNITKIAARASDQQLAAALRQGIGHDGRPLYIMPSPQYSRMTDAEAATLVAWMRSLPRVEGVSGKVRPGPIGRFAMVTGKLRSTPDLVKTYRAQVPIALVGVEPGRQLAATACAECHGPALFGQETPFGPTPDLNLASAYTLEQFEALMRRGVTPSGKKLGMMERVAREDFVNLTDGEIAALHAYLTARGKKLGG